VLLFEGGHVSHDRVMTLKDGSKLQVKANSAVYCPTQTEHNVINTGTDNLRYLYVVSIAR
jgi:mannose-6-phosphate isomerase-like protein (cupin superfamily)